MLLHGVKDPPELFERWRQMLSPEGFVMFSCLGPGALRGLKDIYHRRGWPTHSIEFVDMHDLGDMLVRSGFADPVMDQETLTIQWDNPHALCDDLRLLGGNASPTRFGGLRTSRWLGSLHNELQILKNDDGKLSLEFEIVYGHAFKAPVLKPISVETRVPLEEMRRLMPSAKAAN
jgi:malonyl-CoA O-methyltransferase